MLTKFQSFALFSCSQHTSNVLKTAIISKFLDEYRITGFFCGCKFLRFVSKIGTCNFCDFIFCDFTPWQSDLYSLDDMKKTSRVTLNALIFMGMCIKLIFRSIEHIDRSPKQKHLCLVLVNKS